MPTTIVKTVKPAGGGDYTSLAAWEAGEQADLVGLDQIRVAECYPGTDAAWGGVEVSGWNTDANRYPVIRAAPGAEARFPWDATAQYTLWTPETWGTFALDLAAPFARVERIAVDTERLGLYFATGGRASGVVVRSSDNGAEGFRVWADGVTVRNCVAWYFNPSDPLNPAALGNWRAFTGQYGTGQAFANCLAFAQHPGKGTGYTVDGGATVRNCVAANTLVGFALDDAPAGASCNVAPDGTAPGVGSFSASLADLAFASPLAGDFRLTAASALRDAGADLSATGFAVDALGTARPQGAGWDVGPVEYVPTTAPATLSPPAVANLPTVLPPSVAATGRALGLPFVGLAVQVFAPAVLRSGSAVAAQLVEIGATVLAPTVFRAGSALSPPLVAGPAAVLAPAVAPGSAFVAPAALAYMAAVYAPTVRPAAAVVAVPALLHAATVPPPFIAEGVPDVGDPIPPAVVTLGLFVHLAGPLAPAVNRAGRVVGVPPAVHLAALLAPAVLRAGRVVGVPLAVHVAASYAPQVRAGVDTVHPSRRRVAGPRSTASTASPPSPARASQRERVHLANG
jgi:hypothetical protein